MPFSRPSLSTLNQRILDDIDSWLPGADSRLRRSVLGVLGRVLAGAAHGLYGLLDWMWRQIFPDTAEAEQLARWAAIWGVARKAAIAARGDVTLTGTSGATVPPATMLVRADGAEYLTRAAATLSGGTATVAVEALIAGVAGNAAPGQRLSFVSPVAGINAQALVATGGLIGGEAEESDELLRGRLLERIQQPPHGGNRADYARWALEVPGVTRAWVAPGEAGIGTVTVRFVMDGREDIIPQGGDVAAVQAYIDERRPVTATVIVVAPIAAPLPVTLRAAPASSTVQDAIREELADLLRREAVPGGTLLISHIREAVSLAAGEIDHELIAPVGNVVSPIGHLAVPGTVSFVP